MVSQDARMHEIATCQFCTDSPRRSGLRRTLRTTGRARTV